MTEYPPHSHPARVTRLNATPLSRHLASLLRQEGVSPQPHLLVPVELVYWMAEHHYANQTRGEMEAGAVGGAAQNDPEATYQNLTDDARLMQATTLDEAAQVMAAILTQLLD